MDCTAHRVNLEQTLRSLARETERVGPVMEMLEPLFRVAEQERFDLAPPSAIDHVACIDALNLAMPGCGIQRLGLTSARYPFPKPKWMTRESWMESLQRRTFAWPLRDGLARHNIEADARLHQMSNAHFDSSFGLSSALIAALHAVAGIEVTLWGIQPPDTLGVVLLDPISGVFLLVLYFCLTAVNGDAASDRFVPLLRMLPHMIPIGKKQDDTGTMFVLCGEEGEVGR